MTAPVIVAVVVIVTGVESAPAVSTLLLLGAAVGVIMKVSFV